MILPNLINGMNSTQWPLDLTNVTLYSSKKNVIKKYNTYVNNFLSQKIFLPCPHQVEIIGYSLSKLEVKLCSYP